MISICYINIKKKYSQIQKVKSFLIVVTIFFVFFTILNCFWTYYCLTQTICPGLFFSLIVIKIINIEI